MALEAGESAPDFTLDAVDGPRVALGEIRRAGESALLVFLRYLG
jgi:peroxiredoxin